MQLPNAQILTTKYDFNFDYNNYIDGILHEKYPHRNEKYYSILLRALDNFIQPSFKLNLTAQNIIKESNSARPTWYSYFRSVEDYYIEIFQLLGDVMVENTINQLKLLLPILYYKNTPHQNLYLKQSLLQKQPHHLPLHFLEW